MKTLIGILISFLIIGCITKKRCAELNKPIIETKDSIIYKEVLKDTTIYFEDIKIQYRDTLMCDSTGIIKNFKADFENKGIKGTVRIINNKIYAECKTDSLQAVIWLKQREIERIKSTKETIIKPCTHSATLFDKICYIMASILLIIVFLKIIKYVRPLPI